MRVAAAVSEKVLFASHHKADKDDKDNFSHLKRNWEHAAEI